MTSMPLIGRRQVTRRRLVGAALAAGVGLPIIGARPGVGGHGRPRAGAAHPARADRAVPGGHDAAAPRRPGPAGSGGRAGTLPRADGRRLVPRPGRLAVSARTVDCPRRHARASHLGGIRGRRRGSADDGRPRGRPGATRAGRLPVVVFSHGAHDHRADNTVVVQELASHGYVVDHGRSHVRRVQRVPRRPGHRPGRRAAAWARGTSPATSGSSSTRVEKLAAGRNPDAGQRTLPAGLSDALDPGRIGVFGWSKGATADRPDHERGPPRARRAGLRRPDAAADRHRAATGRSC